MNEIERDRVARARNLARLDPLGLRYRLPESIDIKLRAALRRRSGGGRGEDPGRGRRLAYASRRTTPPRHSTCWRSAVGRPEDEPELAAKLRIEERELEAGGLN